MRLLKPIILAITMLLASVGLTQIPAPQINLSGNLGCQGFPCLNNGTLIMASDANRTMTAQETSAMFIKVTSSVSLTATRNLIAPAGRFPFTIENATTGSQSIQIIGASGTGVTIANGATVSVWNDGTNFVQIGAINTPPAVTCSTTASSATPTYVFSTSAPCTQFTLTQNVTSASVLGAVAGSYYSIVFINNGGFTAAMPSQFKGPSVINLATNGRTQCLYLANLDGNLYLQGCSWF